VAVEDPVRAVVSRWATDPDVATAYSYLRPGGTPDDRDRLGELVAPGLALAGEATWAAHPGTMHGAWFSGERAAARVLADRAGSARMRAAVVGAGLAGLAAGRALRAAGADVVVLEAAEHPGGRAATDRTLGGPVHPGAAWLHGDRGNPVAEAAARAGVRTTPSHWGRRTTYVVGRGALDESVTERLEAARERVGAGIEAARRTATIDDVLGPVAMRLLDAEAPGGLDRLVLEAWVRGTYENLYAAPIDDLSLCYAEEPFRLPGRDLTLLGGLDAVVAELADDLDLRTGERVTSVVARDGRWSVGSTSGDLVVDVVVVTIPVGALHHDRIRFDPPLPPEVRASLGRIGAGTIAKVFLAFAEPFWDGQWAFWTADRPPADLGVWVDVSELAGRPTLCGMATGDRARRIEQMPEDAVRALGAGILRAARVAQG
jgi:monoamine oxidase